MRVPAALRPGSIVLSLVLAPHAAAGQAPACTGIVECRAQTEAAIAQGEFERAHDLGWRTVQQGPRNDRALMFLLARTQALSNRPDDALVMIRRLAEMGAVVDVSADEFARTRDLPGWPAVEAVIAGLGKPPVVPPPPPAPKVMAPTATVGPKAPTPEPPKATPVIKAAEVPMAVAVPKVAAPAAAPVLVEEAGRFSSSEFSPGGLACDAVSRRFVFGDRTGRKLLVVAEGRDHSIDLTRADVAGFLDVTALDIDTTNGNLWVASAEADGRGATLHRVQLISGRPIARFAVPETLVPAMPLDVTMASVGVLLLDSLQHRLLILRPGSTELAVFAELGEVAPLSMTASRQDGVAYVTHRDGLLAIDLKTRAVTAVTAAKTVGLGGVERLRRHGSGFVGLQAMPDGSRRLIRLTLDARGRAVTRVRVLDAPLPEGSAAIPMAVCGDTLGYLISDVAVAPSARVWTVRRIQLSR